MSFLFLVWIGTTGCRTLEPFSCAPCPPVPDAWENSLQGHLEDGAELEAWWKTLGDPALEALICATKEGNPRFRAAAQRILQLRAERSAVGARLFPAVSGTGSAQRIRNSTNYRPIPGSNPTTLYLAGAATTWELDFFGRIRKRLDVADASIQSAGEAYRDLVVLLFAETAVTYIQYRTAEERLRVAEINVELQNESFRIARDKLDAGLVSRIDVTQATSNLESTRSQIPLIRNELAALRNRLVFLTGGNAGCVTAALSESRGIPLPPNSYAVGTPCDLIRSRPDIRQAERELAAAAAGVGVAETELYPKFVLAGEFSFQSSRLPNLFSAASGAYTLGPSFSWNLFNAGQIRKLIVAEEAKTNQALAAYELSVLSAIEEVQTAMASIRNERDRYRSLGRAVNASKETVGLVLQNYDEGLIDFQRVIDTQRVQFQNEDQAAISKGQISANYVLLYKALGGGSRVCLVPRCHPLQRSRGPFLFKNKPVVLDPAPADGAAGKERDRTGAH